MNILATIWFYSATDSSPNQEFMFRTSFHLGVKGDVWSMLGFPLDIFEFFENFSYSKQVTWVYIYKMVP